MKFRKADTDILFEALGNGSCVNGRKSKLLCSYVGTVEIVKGLVFDEEGCPDYYSEYYLAGQLPTMEIIGIDENNNAFSLSGEVFTVHWGFYPEGFADEYKTTRPAPDKFACKHPVECNKASFVDTDELPF